MVPIQLDQEQRHQVLRSVIGADGKEYSASRICRRLAGHLGVRTRIINAECSCGNISDIVNKSINPFISHLGLYVACARPARPFQNRFKQQTGECLWGFYSAAANDDHYDRLDDDINDLASKYPGLLAGERTVNDWERDLAGSLK
jgi:hypothetical protein